MSLSRLEVTLRSAFFFFIKSSFTFNSYSIKFLQVQHDSVYLNRILVIAWVGESHSAVTRTKNDGENR